MKRMLLCCALALALSSVATVAYAQPAPDVLEFSLPSSATPGQDIVFTVRATNRGQLATSGSISVSFPDQPTVTIVESSPFTNKGSYAQVFQPGASIYNFSQAKTMAAQYPLAELYYQENWSSGQERYLTMRVSAPANRSSLTVQARVTLRSGAGFFTFPDSGATDQQGFKVDLRLVQIRAANPPTNTAVPTGTAQPSPTPQPTRTSTAVPSATPRVTPSATTLAAASAAGPGLAASGASPGVPPAVAVAGITTDTSSPSGGGSAVVVLLGLLTVVGAIAVAAVAFTRRPAARAQQATAPYSPQSYPPPGPPSYPPPGPQSYPPPGPPSFPPAGPQSYPPPAARGPAAGPALPSGYQIVGAPKHGGMAAVYKAFQPSLHRYVALKVLSPSLGSDGSFLERFQSEARWTARLEHPNIVPIYDMGLANGSVFIVMRFIDGFSLQELLDRETRFPMGRTMQMAAQVASALDYAHAQGFVHRDVKPANIMVEQGDRVTLTDFGIAKVVGESRLTRTGAIVGTPEYLSPEQARGDQVDGRADLYALGIVVYEMLAGRPPFQADNPLSVVHAHLMTPPPTPIQFNAAIPASVAAVLLKVLAKDPAQRYATADAFVQALRQAAGGQR